MRRLTSYILALFLFLIPTLGYPIGMQVDFLLSPVRSATYGLLAGGKVYFYEAGTTTLKAVYLDRSKTSQAANPYTLSANGTALLFADGLYRIVIKTSADVTVYDYDNLTYEGLATGFSGDNTGRIQYYTFGAAAGTDNAIFNDLTVNGSFSGTVLTSFDGALVYRSTSQTLPDATQTTVLWDSENYDTNSFHDGATNTDRLTVPSGVTKVRVVAHIRLGYGANPVIARAYIYKNNSVSYTGYTWLQDTSPNASYDSAWVLVTPVLTVTSGDYFTVETFQDSDTAGTVSNQSWFMIEVVESS